MSILLDILFLTHVDAQKLFFTFFHYCWKWLPLTVNEILSRPRWLNKMIELDQHVGYVLKELILKTLQCAGRIFDIHLSVLHPESNLHMCSPEKDMKGIYSFGTFPLSFLHTSCISNVIRFEVMGTELMWALY